MRCSSLQRKCWITADGPVYRAESTAMQILNMHSTNLLPTVSDLDTSGAGEV